MEEQIRDVRSILRHGKHISELKEERNFYRSEIEDYANESDTICEKLKLMQMSSAEQRDYHIANNKKLFLFLSFVGLSFYNLALYFIAGNYIKLYFVLLLSNIIFLYCCMVKYNKIENIENEYIEYSENEYQELIKQFESNEEDYENALMEYEDRCRKLKKLGVDS